MFYGIYDLRGKYTVSIIIALFVSLFAVTSSVRGFCSDGLYISAASAQGEEKLIIIDAGHGGEDCGAIGVNGVYEKDINLSMANYIGEELRRAGYAVVYTRTEDRLLYREEQNIKGIRKISDLKNRCEIASSYPSAIFVSIHMNSFGMEKYSGLQVYYSTVNQDSSKLAQQVQSRVQKTIQNDNKRKVKPGKDIYLLENMTNPSILIECGFLSNREECEKLSQKEYQKQLSFQIVCGIIEYIEAKTSVSRV